MQQEAKSYQSDIRSDESESLLQHDQEAETFLPQTIDRKIDDKPGTSTIVNSIISLLNSIIGVGVMTLPYCLKLSGYGLGSFYLILNFFLTHITYTYIAEATQYTQCSSYREIGRALLGKNWLGITLSLIIVVYVFGSLSSYAIAIMDNMFWWEDDTIKANVRNKQITCSCIIYLVVVPLSSLPKIDFMKYNSWIALICEIIVMSVVIAFYFIYNNETGQKPVVYRGGILQFSTLPLMSASMCGHFAMSYLYTELKNRSQKRMNIIILANFIILFIMYASICYFGYFTFLDDSQSDIFKTMAKHAATRWYLQLGHVAQLLLIICHFPVTAYGMRMALESVIWQNGKMPKLYWQVIIVIILMTVILVMSLTITEISTVMDVTSTLGGSFVIFMIPAGLKLIILRKQRSKWQHSILPGFIFGYGIFQLIFGFAGTVMTWFQ